MRVAIERAAAVLVSLLGACPFAAQAQPAHVGAPFVVEGHLGLHDPLGSFGMALVYDRGYRFSAGIGLGLDSVASEALVTASLFGRARLFRKGAFALDVGAILSRGGYTTEREYHPPESAAGYRGERLTVTWIPDYRATGTLAAEVANRRWSLRLEAGLGYHLNRPTCHYEGSGIEFTGDCNSTVIPDVYHFAMVPGRLSPSLSLTAGYRLGVEEQPLAVAAGAAADYRSPSTALSLSVLSTAIPTLIGATMVSMWLNSRHHDNNALLAGGIAGLGLGLGFGPSIGYAYAGEHLRAWGGGLLRLVGVGAGALAVAIDGLASSSCDGSCGSGGAGDVASIGMLLFVATSISTIYDVATAPRAAQRANARHGLDNLALVPVPIRDATSTRPGLSLLGQF